MDSEADTGGGDDGAKITCPVCGRTSYNRGDVEHEFCATCGYHRELRRGVPGSPVEPFDYVIWSNEHGAWWKPARCGYTKEIRRAGWYQRQTALAICGRALFGSRVGIPNEIPVRVADMLDMPELEEWFRLNDEITAGAGIPSTARAAPR